VGKGKRVDVYLEVRKRKGHIFLNETSVNIDLELRHSTWVFFKFYLVFIRLILEYNYVILSTGYTCSCPPTYTPSNVTLEEKVDELVKVLTIDKTTLSSYKNARISAPDSRPSARGIGSVAAVLLSTLVVVLLISDLPLVILHLKLMKANLSGGFHRFCAKQQ
jgi:hypothetical protein